MNSRIEGAMSKATNQRKLDYAWVTFLTVTACGLGLLLSDSLFDFSVLVSGLICVSLTAIGRREGYLFGIYTSLAYSLLAYQNGLFGEVYLNLFFFVPTGVIGYLMWRKHMQDRQIVQMRQLSLNSTMALAVICVISSFALGKWLAQNPDQNTPFIDASTNILSIIATFLMMWRYKEQWLLYIVLNVITIFMWFLRVLEDGTSGDMMVLLWSMYLMNSIYGYWRWHKGAQHHKNISDCFTGLPV